jgi:exosortase
LASESIYRNRYFGGLGAHIGLPFIATAAAFTLLFARPAFLLAQDWVTDPENGHGLLLVPVAVGLAWRVGLHDARRPYVALGTAMLTVAVAMRYASGLAAELFTMRLSMVLAAAALTVYFAGPRQLTRWWLPFALVVLSIPVPDIIMNAAALPLQLQASRMGAAMLAWRHVPVELSGNVLRIPGQELFVATACSGLRSLTALTSLGLLLGHSMLQHPLARALIVLLTFPVAIVLNGVRVFLTAFLMHFVSADLGTGFMHVTEGWLLFLVSLCALAVLAWLAASAERYLRARSVRAA